MSAVERESSGTAAPSPHGPDTPVQWRLGRETRNYTVLTFSVGLLLLCFNVTLLTHDHDLSVARFAIILFLFGCIVWTPGLKIRRGDHYVDHKFWEYPIIVGFALAPAYAVAVAMTLAYAIIGTRQVISQSEHRARVPMAFGTVSIATTLGCFVATLHPPVTYPVGCVLMFVISEALLYGYDRTAGDPERAWWALTDDWGRRLAVPVLSSVLVTGLTYTIGPQRAFLLILPVSLLLLYWMITWLSDNRHEKAAWRHMESISAKFIGELDEANAIKVALEESLQLFSARRAEVVLPGTAVDTGTRWSLEMGPGNRVAVEILPPTDTPEPMPQEDSDRQVIALTTSGDRHFGYLMLEWDPMAPENQTRKRLTNTFGHSVALSIANTRHNKHISQQAAEKAWEAERDPLTGLGNRSMLAERGPALLSESADIQRSCALLVFDLDGFKRVNDTLGHAAGDHVLVEVARRIRATTRRNDLVIRLGGDEFAVLAVDLEMPADAEQLAAKITRALSPPIDVEDLQLSAESSIGIALYPNDGEDIESLLKLADIAMYQAKAVGRGKVFRYNPSINFNTTESLMLAADLRKAIFSPDLLLHYQPQVDLKTGRVIGVEGLIRWNHPTLGMLYPDRFVNIAERSNLIRPFTVAIIEKALADRRRMREVLPDATVSVNLSAQNLLDTGLPSDVRRLLSKYQIEPRELVLEVTETTTAKDVLAADKVLTDLSQLGCPIAMDDFGSGYSTMESLRSGSPINEVKIDRGFIKDIATNDRDCRVAAAIIEIAHAWDCRVVAEGIEDEETYVLLRDMDCDTAQGYWMHKPAPLEEILDWVKGRHATG